MAFTMQVFGARQHRQWYVLGVEIIGAGTWRPGCHACVLGRPDLRVETVTLSFVDGPGIINPRGRTTGIEQPPFPIQELVGRTLVDCEQPGDESQESDFG